MSEKMSDQFGGLDMSSLIGGPLKATCDAQVMLAKSTADFINNACMTEITPDSNEPDKKVITARTVNFSFNRPVNDENSEEGTHRMENVDLTVLLPAIVKVPALAIDSVDISFDMEVKSSKSSKEDKKS